MLIRSILLDNQLDGVALGSASGLLWRSERVTIAGFGSRHKFEFTGLDQLDSAFQALNSRFDSGPSEAEFHAFVSLQFDSQSNGEIVLAEYTYIDDGTPRIVVVAENPDDLDAESKALVLAAGLIDKAEAKLEVDDVQVQKDETDQWKQTVRDAVDAINVSALNKVVLARKLTANTNKPVSIPQVCRRLAETFSSSLLFVHDGFVGASPEMLIAKKGDAVSAHPLAGTAPRSGDSAIDASAKAALLESTKDQWEHRITIEWFLDTLLPFCSFVDAEPSPTVVELANVFHLGTKVDGRLSSVETSVAELVAALHPTPAVGGEPQDLAVSKIAELEQFSRGNYAGPTGWINAAGDGEFAVAIRSAQVSENRVELFAGVGVVSDSDPDSELAETDAKFAAMFTGLGIC